MIKMLREQADKGHLEKMERFGINTGNALGVPVPAIRKLSKLLAKDHALALQLWQTGCHEARILASMVDDPRQVTVQQIDDWAADFNSWDVCDQVCGNLFDRTAFAVEKAKQFSGREEEYIKRAGFVLMAEMAVHDKSAKDEVFLEFLPVIEKEAWDERNFVKKAVNWSLRQIGKRNGFLNPKAISVAQRIGRQESRSAKWIATDALRELQSEKVRLALLHKSPGSTVMTDRFSTTVTINAEPLKVWTVLTNPALMTKWMGEPEMKIEVCTDWEINTPVFIRGFHHVKFENKGIVLRYDEGKMLSYSHMSSVSRLPDQPENYSILEFILTPVDKNTQLTLNIKNFPTEVIRKHLEFYWRTTIITIKKMVEREADPAQHAGPVTS